jgi:hypothetical protein
MDYYYFNKGECLRTKNNVFFCDIEVDVGLNNKAFPEAEKANAPINLITTSYNSHMTCYVLDNKTEIADAFGATRTPQVFLFNKEFKLNYKGSIDDNVKDAAAVSGFDK